MARTPDAPRSTATDHLLGRGMAAPGLVGCPAALDPPGRGGGALQGQDLRGMPRRPQGRGEAPARAPALREAGLRGLPPAPRRHRQARAQGARQQPVLRVPRGAGSRGTRTRPCPRAGQGRRLRGLPRSARVRPCRACCRPTGDEDCFRCHDAAPFQRAHVHKPLRKDGCAACHDPHGSAEPALLEAGSRRALPLLPRRRRRAGAATHSAGRPRLTGCVTCHDPHSSDDAAPPARGPARAGRRRRLRRLPRRG